MKLPRAGRSYFVTGTDTGVGKTLIACALLRACAARGLKSVGMKPVASGATPGGRGMVHEDVVQLVAASNVRASREDVNPYCFEPPIAPHIAARQAGVEIELERIERSYRRLAASAEVVVVEGVGGLLVPIAERFDMAHLAERLALPVVLVVGLRLGCLNHALLTAAAIRARGLEFAGWVANQLDPRMDAVEENLAALRQRIGAPLWARIAHLPRPDFDAVARLLDAAAAS